MGRSITTLIMTTLAMALAAGCSSSPWQSKSSPDEKLAALAGAPAFDSPQSPTSSQTAMAPGPSEDQEVREVVAEMRRTGGLKSQAEEDELVAGLSQLDPTTRMLALQNFRGQAQYREQLTRRDTAKSGNNAPAPSRVPGPETSPRGRARETSDNAFASSPGPLDSSVQRMMYPGDSRSLVPGADVARDARSAQRLPDTGQPGTGWPTVPSSPYRRAVSPPIAHDASTGRLWPSLAQREAPPVGHSPRMQTAGDWQAQLALAAETLEAEIPEMPQSSDEVSQHAKLRLIQLLAGHRDRALQPIPAFDAASEEFWFQQMYGLDAWLNAQRTSDSTARVIETKRSLSEAVNRLRELAPLEVRNVTLCYRIDGFGSVQEYEDGHEFAPGEVLLIYAEVENQAAEPTSKGFRTSLRSSYVIVDSRRHHVVQQDFPAAGSEEYCQRPRRDFYYGRRLQLPDNIQPGKHTLQLTIEDLVSKKVAQAKIEFVVKVVGR